MKTYPIRALICFSLFVFIAAQLRADLPPDAQEAIKKGIIAAKEQEWDIAIQSFQDARKIAPNAPEIYYNLGLAESKIPGRELRAIAWFGAYLAAATNAPNAAAVNDFITELQIKSEGNINRLIKSVQDAASPSLFRSYLNVAGLWAEVGDVPAAMNTVSQIKEDGEKSEALDAVVAGQAKSGDIAGAFKTADSLQDSDKDDGRKWKSFAQKCIASAQAEAGDIAGAQKTTDLIQDKFQKVSAEVSVSVYRNDIGARPVPPIIAVSDWLHKLDDGDDRNDCALNTAPFLELATYLKSPHSTDPLFSSDNPQKVFDSLADTAKKIVEAQNIINQMLKQQAKQQAKQNTVKALDDGEFDVHKSGDTPHYPPPPPPPSH